MDKPIFVECGCCGAKVEIHPSHAQYFILRLQLMRELHPEVGDEEPLEERRVAEAEEQLRLRFISPDPQC